MLIYLTNRLYFKLKRSRKDLSEVAPKT